MVNQQTTLSRNEEGGNVPRPRLKRLLRMSLRTMLLVVGVLCVVLALKVRQAERQKEAVAWVIENGGGYGYGYEFDEDYRDGDKWNPRPAKDEIQPPGPEWLRNLIGVDYFATGVRVLFPETPKSSDLSPLAKLPELRTLYLAGTNVNDLSPLADLPRLEYLRLSNTPVSDLSPLTGAAKLEILHVDGTQVVEPLAAGESRQFEDARHHRHQGYGSIAFSLSNQTGVAIY